MKYIFIIAFTCIILTSCNTKNKPIDVRVGELKELMQQSAQKWNNADLDGFMSFYDSAATFMFSTGPVGLDKVKANYEKGFFKDGKPLQQLRFEDIVVRSLGSDHALLTGKFILYGNNLPERSGIYSLIFIRRGNSWKILHDHSS